MQKKISRTLMESGRVKFVRLEKLRPNPSQPRRVFDPAGLQELAESIKTYGILQPSLSGAPRRGWSSSPESGASGRPSWRA